MEIQEIADLAVVALMKERFINISGQIVELPARNVKGVIKLPDNLPLDLGYRHYDITMEWGAHEEALSIEDVGLEVVEPAMCRIAKLLQSELQGEWVFIQQELMRGCIKEAVGTNKQASVHVKGYFEPNFLKNLLQLDVILINGGLIKGGV